MCHIESQWVNEHTDDVHLNKMSLRVNMLIFVWSGE